MDGRAVEELRQLAASDEELARGAARLRELDAEVASVRTAAEAIDAFFVAYPDEESRRRGALRGAESALERRRAELAEAEAEAARARDAESREHAERVVVRARDRVSDAEASHGRAARRAGELERRAASLPEELPPLEQRARRVAAEVPEVPEPPSGPRALVEWASHAHAELFVAAGQLDARRDRVIREANELASMLLGEPTYGSTVAAAFERVAALHAGG